VRVVIILYYMITLSFYRRATSSSVDHHDIAAAADRGVGQRVYAGYKIKSIRRKYACDTRVHILMHIIVSRRRVTIAYERFIDATTTQTSPSALYKL